MARDDSSPNLPSAGGPTAEPKPSPITTTDDFSAIRRPESGPSDTDEAVNLTSKDGTKVTAPQRLVEKLEGQGFTK